MERRDAVFEERDSMEVAAGAGARRTRRYRSAEERCRIVEETLVSGVSVATVARAHGLNANLVFHWRKLYHAGILSRTEGTGDEQRMLPVTVSGLGPELVAASVRASAVSERSQQGSSGSIELTLSKAQVRIAGTVDAAALRVILECLLG